MVMLRMPIVVLALCAVALGVPQSAADEPFYRGKRLTLIINFAAGGPTDIEGRLLAKHLAKHIAGNPGILVQNMDGAGGMIGAGYLGEVAPKDGTSLGYFTGSAWRYANNPERFRVDFRTYEFVAYQPGTSIAYMRTDVPPGIKEPDRHRPGEGRGGGRTGRRELEGSPCCGSGSTCSACRTNTSPPIAAARRRGWPCSRTRSTSMRNRRRAIAPWSSRAW